MTDAIVKKTKYKYDLNSNLVIQGAGSGNRGENDPSGEGETLVGKKLAPFGDMAQREKPPELKQLKEKQQKREELKKKRIAKGEMINSKKMAKLVNQYQRYNNFLLVQNLGDAQNILDVNIQEDLVYRPKTKETKYAYEQILYIVQRHMGDISQEDIKGATDQVLAILKTESTNDAQRKRDIQTILDFIDDETFNRLTVLAQDLVDFRPEINQTQGGTKEEDIDAQVDFDLENDDEDDSFDQINEDDDENYDDRVEDEEENKENDEENSNMDNENDQGMQIDTQSKLKKQQQRQKSSFAQNDGLLDINDIDSHWLNRILNENFKETMSHEEILVLENDVLSILGNREFNKRECERKLSKVLTYEKQELINLLDKNRHTIYFCTKINQAQNQSERDERIKELLSVSKQDNEIRKLYLQITQGQSDAIGSSLLQKAQKVTQQYTQADMQELLSKKNQITDEILNEKSKTFKQLDLENLYLQQEAHAKEKNNAKSCILPKGSQKIIKNGYQEVYVPAIRHKQNENEKLIPITDLPEWAQAAFPPPIKTLNQIQSRLYKSAFQSHENLLVCAPTGAGKTNIALLTIMQVLSDKRRSNGKFDINSFKVVYIAPMKALVTEIVGNFDKRLKDYGLKIRELTGDVHLTKQQIDETQIIVTTPEKWDIITRKSGDRAYIDLVKLIIIDEIHLLHDLRGPVLESIVARTIRSIEATSELIRIVALSATLPNYQDVADFLRVNPETGLYFFDNSFRPVPLEQIYVGITEKSSVKRNILMNEICYEKVMERTEKQFQILVFVHSRKETVRTAKIIRDFALAKDELHKFLGTEGSSMSKEILSSESKTAKSQDLKDLLPYGIGIHNAGLDRKDRILVENLFAGNHVKVLVSTATLAWGVNLPAHTVIIKGTQIYSPEQGKWVELSPQDMLQMIGRAGRPQYDKMGEGIIITKSSELHYYLSLNNLQLPIESQLMSQLADQLNAEIVLGTISNTKEAINWLAYTYLYVRMLRAPQIYGIDDEELLQDPKLIQRRIDLIHSAALLLQKSNMIKYERKTGVLQPTAIGKVASHYYIKHSSMSVYNENLKPHMNMIDLFRLFSLSKEFQFIPVRDTERLELQKFIDKVPIPVKGSLEESSTKINILLQAYISKFKLEGYDLNADMIYVTQSAGRIMRAIFDISMKKNWAQLAEAALTLCKMAERRMWSSMTPLRQYKGIPEEILRKIEKKEQFSWQHYYDMSAQQIGEILKSAKTGKLIHRLIHQFPRLELEAFIQPLTRTVIRIELAISAEFDWEPLIHGKAEPFHILVLDCDQEQILHSEQFILKDKHVADQHILTFTVPLYDPMPPQYFIKVISDRWIQSETVLPVNFKHLILPERFSPPIELQDLHSRLIQELNFQIAEEYFGKFQGGIGGSSKEFNAIQTQVFQKVYLSDESVFIGAPTGSSNIVCGELAIFRQLKQHSENFKVVYLCPVESLCKLRFKKWSQFFGSKLSLNVKLLCGSSSNSQLADLQIVNSADIIIATPERWDGVSRKWKQRKAIQQVSLYIFDEIHLLSEYATYEVVASRVRYMQNESEKDIRIVALSTSLANAKDVSNWLGIPFPQNTFNFHPSVRPIPLEIQMQGFDHNNRSTRVLAMVKPAYNILKKNLPYESKAQGIIFVSDRKQVRMTSIDLVTFATGDENPFRFLNRNTTDKKLDEKQWDLEFLKINRQKISEQTLLNTLEYGIGMVHDGLNENEITYIKHLYLSGVIRVIVATEGMCWELGDLESHLVIILDAEKYDGQQKRYVEYQIPDVLQMMGISSKTLHQSKGGHSSQSSKCVLFCHTPKKEYFVKFLQEPLPIESSLDHQIHDHLNASIVADIIKTKQDAVDWITWTFLYRRVSQNPNYYNITGKTGQHINDYLSELIEQTVDQLQKAKCIEVKGEEEMDLEPGNLGRIAAFYGIKYQTMEMFSQELGDSEKGISGGANKKLKDLIKVLAMSSEFETIPIRQGEDKILKAQLQKLTYPIEGDGDQKYNETHNKTIILLQCHFNRRELPVDLRIDLKLILEKSVKLIHAMIDVLSSHGYLRPCLVALGLCQMIVQAMWHNENPLLQLPYITKDKVSSLKQAAGVEDIADFMNMEDEELRIKILQVSENQLAEIASVCNRYPYVDLAQNLLTPSVQDGDTAEIEVTISRSNVEDSDLELFAKPVFAQYYPTEKEEQWWVIIGDHKENKLLGIKKINLKDKREVKTQIQFDVNFGRVEENDHHHHKSTTREYNLYLFCDSYVGCDIEEQIKVQVEK